MTKDELFWREYAAEILFAQIESAVDFLECYTDDIGYFAACEIQHYAESIAKALKEIDHDAYENAYGLRDKIEEYVQRAYNSPF